MWDRINWNISFDVASTTIHPRRWGWETEHGGTIFGDNCMCPGMCSFACTLLGNVSLK